VVWGGWSNTNFCPQTYVKHNRITLPALGRRYWFPEQASLPDQLFGRHCRTATSLHAALPREPGFVRVQGMELPMSMLLNENYPSYVYLVTGMIRRSSSSGPPHMHEAPCLLEARLGTPLEATRGGQRRQNRSPSCLRRPPGGYPLFVSPPLLFLTGPVTVLMAV
jgi:hypothetical protein